MVTQRLVTGWRDMVGPTPARDYGIAKLCKQRGEAELPPNLISGGVTGPRGRMRMSVHFRPLMGDELKEQTASFYGVWNTPQQLHADEVAIHQVNYSHHIGPVIFKFKFPCLWTLTFSAVVEHNLRHPQILVHIV